MKQTIQIFMFGMVFILSLAAAQAARLPSIGSDSNSWGNVLNDYLSVSHDQNGTIKNSVVTTNMLNTNNITLNTFTNDVGYLTTVVTINLQDNAVKKNKLNLTNITLSTFTNDLPANSVNTSMIQNESITGPKINENAVASSKIIDNTIQNRDINSAAAINYGKLNLSNGIVDSDVFNVSTSKITGLANFVVANELNPTNVTIELGSIGGYGPIWKLSNFTAAYESRTDRFENGNYTNLMPYHLANFTSNYDTRSDRFGNANFTALLPPYPTNDTILISLGQVNGRDFTNGLKIGSGANITKHLSGTASLDFGATAATTCDDLNVTVTGAADGDTVSIGVPTALASDAFTSFSGFVSAANTVTVRRCDVTGTAASNPAAATVRVDVWQH